MTLLEVLVALAILALTGLLLSQGMFLGSKVHERSVKEVLAAAQRVEAAQTLRRLIEQAEPLGPDETLPPFQGDAGGLSFYSFYAASLAGGSGRQILIYHDADGEQLRLKIVDLQGAEAESPKVESDLLLLAESQSVSFRYFGNDPISGALAWTDSWEERIDLPSLMEVKVDLRGRAPLVAHIAPRLRQPVSCLLVPSAACWGERR
jgi:type II secretory pathway component PulJ